MFNYSSVEDHHTEPCKGMEYLGNDPEMMHKHVRASDYVAICARIEEQKEQDRERAKRWAQVHRELMDQHNEFMRMPLTPTPPPKKHKWFR